MLKKLLGFLWRSAPKSVRRLTVRMAEPRFTVTAGAVVENEEGRILLLNHVFRKGHRWGIPGGFLSSGEQPEEALRRELREEAGIEIDTVEIAFVRTLRRPQQLEIIYRCRARDPASAGRTPNLEVNYLGWFDPAELPDVTDDQRRVIKRALEKRRAEASN